MSNKKRVIVKRSHILMIYVTKGDSAVLKSKHILMSRYRILVPIDFSTQSDIALEFAGYIAGKLNAMISCIYVIEDQGWLADRISRKDTKHLLRREAENKLSERVNSILKNKDNIAFEIIISSGKIHEKVLEKSMDLDARMIVIGRSKSSGGESTRLGSNAGRILDGSMVPVIVVSNRRIEKRMHLILPLDLESRYSNQLIWGIETALLLKAPVSLIAVVKRLTPGLRPLYLKKLNESRRLFIDNGIECNTHLLENQTTVYREILSFSESLEFGIILLMMHQKKKLSSPPPGSIVSDVLAKAKVPVLFTNSPKKKEYDGLFKPACSTDFSFDDSHGGKVTN